MNTELKNVKFLQGKLNSVIQWCFHNDYLNIYFRSMKDDETLIEKQLPFYGRMFLDDNKKIVMMSFPYDYVAYFNKADNMFISYVKAGYDEELDILMLLFGNDLKQNLKSGSYDDTIIVDITPNGKVTQIEILDASDVLSLTT